MKNKIHPYAELRHYPRIDEGLPGGQGYGKGVEKGDCWPDGVVIRWEWHDERWPGEHAGVDCYGHCDDQGRSRDEG